MEYQWMHKETVMFSTIQLLLGQEVWANLVIKHDKKTQKIEYPLVN